MKIKLKRLLLNIAICIVAAIVSWFISGEILNIIENKMSTVVSFQGAELDECIKEDEEYEASTNEYEGMTDEEKEQAEYENILSQLENGSYHSDTSASGNEGAVSGFKTVSDEETSNNTESVNEASTDEDDFDAKLTQLANRIALTLAILGTLLVVYGYANGLMITAFGELLITIVSIEFFITLSKLTLKETLIINLPLMIVTVIMLIRAIRKYTRQGIEKTIKNDDIRTKIIIVVAAMLIVGAIIVINKKLEINEVNTIENLIAAVLIISMTIMILMRRDSFYLMLMMYFGVKAIKIGLTFINIGSISENDVSIALLVYDVMIILIAIYGYSIAERKLKKAKEKEMETYINIKERAREEVEERVKLGV